MNIYSKKQVWKAFLLLGGLAIALSSLLYTNSIVNKLAVEEEKKVELVAEATKLLARKEAILLDPVYSGKAFAGLIGLIKNKKFTKDENILFIHTGGAVSLSAYEWAF